MSIALMPTFSGYAMVASAVLRLFASDCTRLGEKEGKEGVTTGMVTDLGFCWDPSWTRVVAFQANMGSRPPNAQPRLLPYELRAPVNRQLETQGF